MNSGFTRTYRYSNAEHEDNMNIPARTTGFTLIELMITVVIIAILAGIAYPSYQNYTRQARRADAQSAILQTANRLEKFFTYCNSYPTAAAWPSSAPITNTWPTTCPQNPLPNTAGLCPTAGACNDLSPDRHYQITINQGATAGGCSGASASPACGYTIIANPNGAGVTNQQRNDGSFRMDSRGVKEWDRNNDGDYADAGENKWK